MLNRALNSEYLQAADICLKDEPSTTFLRQITEVFKPLLLEPRLEQLCMCMYTSVYKYQDSQKLLWSSVYKQHCIQLNANSHARA